MKEGVEEENAPLSADSSEKSMLLIMKLRTYWSTEFFLHLLARPSDAADRFDSLKTFFTCLPLAWDLVCKFTAVRTHVIPLKEHETARIWGQKMFSKSADSAQSSTCHDVTPADELIQFG